MYGRTELMSHKGCRMSGILTVGLHTIDCTARPIGMLKECKMGLGFQTTETRAQNGALAGR